jgi:alkylation response protein AidB-like acyl-CoA dehydrogenase
MLETTVAYAKVREQFRRPIGSFQAVKHKLADALLALDFATPTLQAAAWSMATEDDRVSVRTAAAKLRAGQAAGTVGRTALQVHGAIGYSEEHDLHLWLKRTWALQRTWGTASELRARLSTALLIPDEKH